MTELAPLESLFDTTTGAQLPLPAELGQLYGPLRMPERQGRPHVLGNFVSSLDGVVALSLTDQSGGGDISGFNVPDQMVMGLLRAVADAVIVGAGTLRAAPRHLWTAQAMCKPLSAAYGELRARLGKPASPLNVIVTASGALDLTLPVFASGKVFTLIVTTAQGLKGLNQRQLPASVKAVAAGSGSTLSASQVLAAVTGEQPADILLTEGGPHLMADFLAENCLDELFLTLAPQVIGRDGGERPGFAAGKLFAPDDPRWASLVSVKRSASHLFLRYAFKAA